MIYDKNIDFIDESDLVLLIEDEELERTKLDYKAIDALEYNKDKNKKTELLRDVSSFANGGGGMLIYGIDEKNDKPEKLRGLPEGTNVGQIKDNISRVIRDNIEPIINFEIRIINTENNGSIVIIDIKESLIKPHRLKCKDYGFYSRNSDGRYHLDYYQVKNSFLLSYNIENMISNFRDERYFHIRNNEIPFITEYDKRHVFHLVPLSSLQVGIRYDLPYYEKESYKVFNRTGDYRLNSDGAIWYSPSRVQYTQVFWNGIIESVANNTLYRDDLTVKLDVIINNSRLLLDKGIELYRIMDIKPPYAFSIYSYGMKELIMNTTRLTNGAPDEDCFFDKDTIKYPELLISQYPSLKEIEEYVDNIETYYWNCWGIKNPIRK